MKVTRALSLTYGDEAGSAESASPAAPAGPVARLASAVVDASRSRRKTLMNAFRSSGARLLADDSKATNRPEGERSGLPEVSLPGAPAAPLARLTSVTVAAAISRTNTFATLLSSSLERLFASDVKATRFPSPEMLGLTASPLAAAPLAPARLLTRVVVLATRSRTKMLLTRLSSSGDRLSAPDRKAT